MTVFGIRAAVVLAATALVIGCAGQGPPAFPTEVTGTVASRERITIVPGTQVRVTLSETTRADAPAQFIAETTVPDPLQLPVAFRLSFDPRWIDPKLIYTLHARLEREGQLLYINDTPVRVLTGGAPSRVEIVVAPVARRRD